MSCGFGARYLSLTLAVFLLVAGSTIAKAGPTVPHKEHAAGVLEDILPPSNDHPLATMVFVGGGYATHFGVNAIEGSHDFDDAGNVLNCQFATTAAGGATISGTCSGSYSILTDGSVEFELRVFWLEGGRLDGVTGEADVVALLEGVAPGGRV